jgi:hypothetical protein
MSPVRFEDLEFWSQLREFARKEGMPFPDGFGQCRPRFTGPFQDSADVRHSDVNTLFAWSSVPGYSFGKLHQRLAFVYGSAYTFEDIRSLAVEGQYEFCF